MRVGSFLRAIFSRNLFNFICFDFKFFWHGSHVNQRIDLQRADLKLTECIDTNAKQLKVYAYAIKSYQFLKKSVNFTIIASVLTFIIIWFSVLHAQQFERMGRAGRIHARFWLKSLYA